MINIPLQAIPNQSLSAQLDSSNYQIRIHSCNNTPLIPNTAIMTFSITRDGVLLVDNVRGVPNSPLIPYPYLATGNFVLITDNDAYPDYTQFANTQFLIFASQAELEAIKNGSFFN